MKRKPNLRFFFIAEAVLLAAFGLILKNMDDSFGNQLLWTGIALLAYFCIRWIIRLTLKKPSNSGVT